VTRPDRWTRAAEREDARRERKVLSARFWRISGQRIEAV